MKIIDNIRLLWAPVKKRFNRRSVYGFTKSATKTLFASFFFIIKFLYYVMTKPEKITVQMSKTAEKVSEVKIPKFFRKKFFTLYAKKYQVKLDEIVEPLDSFETFSAFFTRKVKPRPIPTDPAAIICPADSKVLKISEITEDKCSIIKGASYSLGELIEGKKLSYTKDQVSKLKKNCNNKLYQVIFYLAPGDYHRFHTPT
jgi:phosphatidylserine decarboxylase